MNRTNAAAMVAGALTIIIVGMWVATPGGSKACGDRGSMGPGTFCYFDVEGTTNSDLMDVRKCNALSLHLNADTKGDETGIEGRLHGCTLHVIDPNTCGVVTGDLDGDFRVTAADEQMTIGGVPGRRGFSNLHLSYPYVYISVVENPRRHKGRWTLKCEG